MYDKDQLETILYVFEAYMQGNDDDELVQKMELICERTSILLEDDEPSDQEMMAAFGTKWHDGL